MELQQEAGLSRTHGLRFLSLPIEDRGVPNSLSEAAGVVATVNDMLARGMNVAIHCRQGIGRSGMIAAAVLTASGLSPELALNRVSEARGLTVPETEQQRAWLLEFEHQVAPSRTSLGAPVK
jgi:protein-tyrosine phosphatase